MPVKLAAPGRRYKAAAVRFYFDADVLGLAHQIAGLRPDATYPGDRGGVVLKQQRQPCPITSTAGRIRPVHLRRHANDVPADRPRSQTS